MTVRVIWTVEDKPDLPSRLVMTFQRTPYSHVAFHVGGEIIHAVGKGVCREPISEFMRSHRIVAGRDVELHCSSEVFWARIEGELGKEYSQAQLLRIATGWKIWFGDNDSRKRICSEFVAALLHEYSIHKFDGDLDVVTPRCVFRKIFGEGT